MFIIFWGEFSLATRRWSRAGEGRKKRKSRPGSLVRVLRNSTLPFKLSLGFLSEQVSSHCLELERRSVRNCLTGGKHPIGRRIRRADVLVDVFSFRSHRERYRCDLVGSESGFHLPAAVKFAVPVRLQSQCPGLMVALPDRVQISQDQAGKRRQFHGELVVPSRTKLKTFARRREQALPVFRRRKSGDIRLSGFARVVEDDEDFLAAVAIDARNGEYSRMVLGVTHDLNPALQGGMLPPKRNHFANAR